MYFCFINFQTKILLNWIIKYTWDISKVFLYTKVPWWMKENFKLFRNRRSRQIFPRPIISWLFQIFSSSRYFFVIVPNFFLVPLFFRNRRSRQIFPRPIISWSTVARPMVPRPIAHVASLQIGTDSDREFGEWPFFRFHQSCTWIWRHLIFAAARPEKLPKCSKSGA